MSGRVYSSVAIVILNLIQNNNTQNLRPGVTRGGVAPKNVLL